MCSYRSALIKRLSLTVEKDEFSAVSGFADVRADGDDELVGKICEACHGCEGDPERLAEGV